MWQRLQSADIPGTTGGQIHDPTSLDARVETEVKILQALEFSEADYLDSSGYVPRLFVVSLRLAA